LKSKNLVEFVQAKKTVSIRVDEENVQKQKYLLLTGLAQLGTIVLSPMVFFKKTHLEKPSKESKWVFSKNKIFWFVKYISLPMKY